MTHPQDNPLAWLNATASSERGCQDSRVRKQRELLDFFVIEVLLGSGDSDIYHILPYIKRVLRQFKLYSYYEERDIFLESYARAVKNIEAGGVIDKISAWFKATSYNVIRELSKAKKRQQLLINRLANEGRLIEESSHKISDDVIEGNVKKILQQSLLVLDSKDGMILKLRIIKGLSWKEICNHLVDIGEEVENNHKLEQRLRQRGKRAIERLRKKYFSYTTGKS
ncbi:MAG: sigma-70 family RNA polymerase sigma factor [Symploca sp. SIO2E6]|nr:sigma-70 family RNA polymerase sigma factor [Symploca sp. SIO2E6]